MDVEKSGLVDMPAFFAEQRRVIMAALAALMLVAMVWNYAFRDFNGMATYAWVQQDAVLLATSPALPIAAVARRPTLQWVAAMVPFAMTLVFFLQFTFGNAP
jgi:hypothetical protein